MTGSGGILIVMAKSKDNLTPLEEAVAMAYLSNGFNKLRAYLTGCEQVGRTPGGRPAESGFEILKRPKVQKFLKKQHDKLLKNREKLAEEVLGRYREIALGDPNELVEHRRHACRYCYGVDHRYQYTKAEWEKVVAEWITKCDEALRLNLPEPKDLDYQGGIGYSTRYDPHEGCPECHGEGVGKVVLKDTRKALSATSLYAGAKRTQQGLEIKIANQDKALEMLAKHLNMFKDDQQAGAGEIHIHFDDKDARA
jgi:phage terminase small subunit